MLNGNKLTVAMDQTLSRDTVAEGAKHEIHCPWFLTGIMAICGPVQNSHNWYIDILMRPQVLQATPHIVWLKTQNTGTHNPLVNKCIHVEPVREILGIGGVDKSS